MASFVLVEKSNSNLKPRARIRICDSFACRFRGLMFRRQLPRDEGLLLVGTRDSRLDSAIHMLFVHFDLAVFWINAAMDIVDKTIARSWRPIYVPARAARFVLEVHPDLFAEYEIGEKVKFVNA